jgi:hypothetical protein
MVSANTFYVDGPYLKGFCYLGTGIRPVNSKKEDRSPDDDESLELRVGEGGKLGCKFFLVALSIGTITGTGMAWGGTDAD